MEITGPNLQMLHQGFNARYRQGLIGQQAEPQWRSVAMRTESATAEENYAWLDSLPGMRRWVGDRVLNQLRRERYVLVNDDYEDTIVVDRNDIKDDRYGVYGARFEALGEAVRAHPDEMVWPLLKSGFDGTHGLAYDGQFFFDTDHPYIDANGDVQSQANTDGGAGDKWFLMDTRRMARPIIYQVREEASDIVMMTDPDDEAVFMRKEFRYGVDCRDAAGYGFYQTCWGSGAELDSAHYATARGKLQGMKGDGGRPLGIMPNLLVVPPSLEGKARTLVKKDLDGGNPWYGSADVLVVPWLS